MEILRAAFYGYEDKLGNNHLMMAAHQKNFQLLEHLMNLDFPFDNQNHLEETVLIQLVKLEEFKFIQILVEKKKAYLNARDHLGKTALFYAKNNSEIYAYLKNFGAIE